MKIIVKHEEFIKNLSNVEKVIDNFSLSPIYKGVFFKIKKNKITIKGTNGIVSFKEKIIDKNIFNVENEGEFLVDAKNFMNVIKFHKNNVEIRKDKEILQIVSSNYKSSLNLLNPLDYPNIDFLLIGEKVDLKIERFKEIIKNISQIALDSKSKMIFKGINIKGIKNKILFITTDTFRIAKEEIVFENGEFDFNITIFSREIRRLLAGDNKKITNAVFSENGILLEQENSTIMIKNIEDVYPEVEKVISKDYKNILEIEKTELLYNIEKTIAISSEALENAISLEINENEIIFNSIGKEQGTLESKTKNNFKWDGEQFKIKFNANYLRDALKGFEGEIKIGFNGKEKPFSVQSNSNKNLIHLILPHKSMD